MRCFRCNLRKTIITIILIFILYLFSTVFIHISITNSSYYYDEIENFNHRTFKKSDAFLNHDWQEVIDSPSSILSESISVYSAFLVQHKGETVIKIVSITPMKKNVVFCHFLDERLQTVGVVSGMIPPTEYEKPEYRDPFVSTPDPIICPLPNWMKGRGGGLNASSHQLKYVAISATIPTQQRNPALSNLLEIVTIVRQEEKIKKRHKFAACIQPIFAYDKLLSFIQWVEFQRMMGVTSFTFYNISIGPRVSCAMRYYQRSAVGSLDLKVLNWTVPTKKIHNNAQIAQMRDCILRYAREAEFVLSFDLDEYLFPNPKLAKNYEELLQVVEREMRNPVAVAGYQFRGQFFGKECAISVESERLSPHKLDPQDLTMLQHGQSTSKLFGKNTRSKGIFVPENVEVPAVHLVREAVGNAIEVYVNPEHASFRHFRTRCEVGCNPVEQFSTNNIDTYATELLQNVNTILKRVFEQKECGIGVHDLKRLRGDERICTGGFFNMIF